MADKAGASGNTIHADEQPARGKGEGSGERKGQWGEWQKMKAVATGSLELKWTKKAEVPDGEVEDGAEGQKKAGTTKEDLKKKRRKKKGAPPWTKQAAKTENNSESNFVI